MPHRAGFATFASSNPSALTRSPTRSPASTPSAPKCPGGSSNAPSASTAMVGTPRASRTSWSSNGETSVIVEPSVKPLIGVDLRQHRERRQVGIPPDHVVGDLHLAEAVRESPALEQARNPGPPPVAEGHDQLG